MKVHSEVPEGWKHARLGDVVSLRRKKVIPTNSDEYRYVGLEHIISGGSLKSCGKASTTVSAKTLFFPGDTLYGKLRPNLRKVTRIDFEGVCSTDILVMFARPCTDNPFVSHLIRSNRLYEYAMRGITGTRMPRTSWAHLKVFSLLLPPLPEQRAIAAVLDSIDETIERTESVITATEQLRDALRHELLTRGLPGRHTESRDVPGLGTIPADWEVVRIGDVTHVNRLHWNPEQGTSIQYLDLTAVVTPGYLSPPKEIAPEKAPSRARRRVTSGDILVSTVRPNLRGFARVCQASNNLVASTGFTVLTPSSMADDSFLYHLVMASDFARYLSKAATGQAYPAVRPSDISYIPFCPASCTRTGGHCISS